MHSSSAGTECTDDFELVEITAGREERFSVPDSMRLLDCGKTWLVGELVAMFGAFLRLTNMGPGTMQDLHF
jgi:hypothetical protein